MNQLKLSRPLLVLLLSLVAGVAAVLLAARWLQAKTGESTPLVVAAHEVPPGTPLEGPMLTQIRWPSSALPQGAQSDPQALLGRVVRSGLARGEPVLEAKLAPQGTRGGLSAIIAPGKRAITVKVNEVVGVAGFALPGSLVDVMVHTQLDEDGHARPLPLSKIVLEDILVLAVAQEASRDETAPKLVNAVTLEVTPQQAEKLDLARGVGTLSLVLRNPVDREPVNTAGIAKNELVERRPAPDAARASWASQRPMAGAAKSSAAGKDARTDSRNDTDGATPGGPVQRTAQRPAQPTVPVEVIRGLQRSTTEIHETQGL